MPTMETKYRVLELGPTLLAIAVGLIAAFALALPARAGASNLFPNSSFDNDVEGWTPRLPGLTAVQWSPVDVVGSSSSGSMIVTNTDPNANQIRGAESTCVGVSPGSTYTFGTDILIPSAQSRTVETVAVVFFYSTADCSGSFAHRAFLPSFNTTGAWISVRESATAPADARSALVLFGLDKIEAGGSAIVHFDNAILLGQDTGCSPDNVAHCFLGSRFRVTVDWATADAAGSATAVPLTDSSGLFWFFNGTNIEMLVKVLDGCSINNHYWVFAAATTDVQYTLTVTDLVADRERTYFNPPGVASAAVTDSTALATCP